MKLAMPPERWTPKGKTLRSITEKSLILGKITIPTRQSTMCSGLPTPSMRTVPTSDTEMEYWYGQEEKAARKSDLAYAKKAFPQIIIKEFKG